MKTAEKKGITVPCCPEFQSDKACSSIDFHYRLTHRVAVNDRTVAVEVLVKARLERCTEGHALGDLVYSNTLLPGEKVRLFSMDRRSRFTFDKESSISYRHEQTSEESMYMSSMSNFMSDLTIRDEGESRNTSKGSASGSGSTSGAIETFFLGASADVSGQYSAESTRDFMREISQHAESSSNRSVEAVRTASSVSMGEVQSRTHAEGESEDHFEAASRTFSNPNQCRAITFFFYQINKIQKVKFEVLAVTRRVIDPAGNAKVAVRPSLPDSGLSVIPSAVLASDLKRQEVEQVALNSTVLKATRNTATFANVNPTNFTFVAAPVFAQPLTEADKAAALKAVDTDLTKAGILSQRGEINEELKAELAFEITTSLPTPGLLVKGCIDECDICEPEFKEAVKLDLERKKLENKLLARKIELLEKSQEYRCCPVPEEVEEAE